MQQWQQQQQENKTKNKISNKLQKIIKKKKIKQLKTKHFCATKINSKKKQNMTNKILLDIKVNNKNNIFLPIPGKIQELCQCISQYCAYGKNIEKNINLFSFLAFQNISKKSKTFFFSILQHHQQTYQNYKYILRKTNATTSIYFWHEKTILW